MDLELNGKVVIVTGASAGIGREIARQFAQEGARVYALARRLPLLQTLVEETPAGTVCALVADVTDPASRAAAVQRVLDEQEKVDVLVNNAGGSRYVAIDAPDEEWREAFELNFHAVRQMAHLVLPSMIAQQGGAIINITGHHEPLSLNAAVAAKAAVHLWVKGLSRDVAAQGVRINSVIPGRIHSEQVDNNVHPDPAAREEFIRTYIPYGRFGEPSEIAPLVLFLSSARATYVTGQRIAVDGGQQRSA